MAKFLKLGITASLCLALSGCFEVEDNSNDAVVAELKAQNEALLAQKTPISIYGNVIDAATEEPVEATLKIKVGSVWQTPISVNGEFDVSQLPVNTLLEILVQSPSDAFMDRVFYVKTTSVDAGQVASQALGNLKVSEGMVKSYSILKADNSEPFEGIVFRYSTALEIDNNNVPLVTSPNPEYNVKSSYDSSTQLYSIELPKDIPFLLTASGDIDGDGIVDYKTVDNYFWYNNSINLSATDAFKLSTLFVNEMAEYQPVELRVSVIDELGVPFENIDFYANDKYTGRLDISFDNSTKEYVFDYQSSGQMTLMMPSFISNEVSYQSGQITLNWSAENELYLYSSGFKNNLPHELNAVDGVASIVVQPRLSYGYNGVNIITSVIDEEDEYTLKQFYASPIGLLDNSVTLVQYNVFKVIRGNDSSTDTVPAGVTRIGTTTVDIPSNGSLKHNDTFLTETATQALPKGDYRYHINQLVNKETGNTFNANRSYSFTVEGFNNNESFNINDVKLDNNNGTTNGTLIVATNTAGVKNTATDNRSTAYLYFPKSIETLSYLNMTRVSSVIDGNTYNNDVRSYNIVIDGDIKIQTMQLVSLADNELIENLNGSSSYYNYRGTTLPDGETYFNSNYYYSSSSDNTATSINTQTFRYTYKVKGDDTLYEGTITLPVL
ncbi:hypothetical protein [Aliikangiella sp. IMCC44359]|uniref:hypothetical protein n=1 Tax=Aliikangiella sp. IMCC44359 TaxID=3459125 RepID=UPI00403B244D